MPALFEASSAAIKTLAADPKYVGTTQCGFFGVLHTWGRTLDYHPHVHYVVPGGGISEDGSQWLPSRADFFVPVRALSILFRAKFRDALERAGLLSEVDPAVWRQDWVVHSKAVGDGRASLKYLAPYVFRVAISDRRIVACEDGQVTFSYRRSGSNRWRKMTVDAFEFIRRFLQHVLPSGFQKVRHYRLPEPQQPGVDRDGALAGDVAQRPDPCVAGRESCGDRHRAVDPLPCVRWPDACARLSAGSPPRLLRYELAMSIVLRYLAEHVHHFAQFEVRGRCALGARDHGLALPACDEFPPIPGHTRPISRSDHSRLPIPTRC